MSFPYHINDVVLARVPNGKIYYTKIRSISLARKECVAEFDDGSVAAVDWINIFDVAAETDVIVCVVCKLGESEPPNEIILCDTCNVGYHQQCHPTIITSQHIAQEKWHCFYCVSKEKNPYIKNPFENSRSISSRSPIKRKRKLVTEPPQQKKIPKKRRKLHRSPPKPPKTPKSFVAKKCTVSIVKKPIPVVPEEFSDASNCSSDQIPEETVHTPPPPVPPPTLPIRPVHTVQPLNHNMAYPACSPPPLQMSPLVKKAPRLYSPPPLMTPRDVTANHSVLMTSLPPLQKARDMNSDPLRSIPDCPSSSWTHSKPSPPVRSTRPVKSEASQQERSEIVESTIPPNPFLEQPPQLPPEDLVSNISSDQIRGLYMRLYDFLQQTRAQGNPVIDREVVQHLISYGNEQIQRLSSAGSISNPEQLDGSSTSSTSSQVTHRDRAGNTTVLSSRGTSSSSDNSVETSAKNNLREVLEQDSIESHKPDSNRAHVAGSPAGGKITLPPRSNSRQTSVTAQDLESLRILMNQDRRGVPASPAVTRVTEQPRSNSGKCSVTNKESLSMLIEQPRSNSGKCSVTNKESLSMLIEQPRSNSGKCSVTNKESLSMLIDQEEKCSVANKESLSMLIDQEEKCSVTNKESLSMLIEQPRSNSGKCSVTNKESLSMLIDQEERIISPSAGRETVTSKSIPHISNPLSSPLEVTVSPQEPSTLTKHKEPLSNLIEVPISSKNVFIKATSSAQPKFDAELKPTKKIISQPLEPFNLAMMGPFIQGIQKKKIKKIPVNRKTAKAVIVKNQEKKMKQLKRPTKSVPSRKRPKPDAPMSAIYTAVQAGNSVIITPNSASNPSTENSVPVQFITEADVPSNTDSSAEFSKTFAATNQKVSDLPSPAQCSATNQKVSGLPSPAQCSATNQKVSDLPSPAQCSSTNQKVSDLPSPAQCSTLSNHGNCTTPLLPVQMSSSFCSKKPIGPSTLNGPLTSISACTNHDSLSFTGDGIAPSNHSTLPKTSVVPPFEQSISCPIETVSQKNDSFIRKVHSVETSSKAPKSDDIVKTIPTIPFQLTMTPTQHLYEKVTSPVSTASIPLLCDDIENDETSIKAQLKNEYISTSDAKPQLKNEYISTSDAIPQLKNEYISTSDAKPQLKNEDISTSDAKPQLKNEYISTSDAKPQLKNEDISTSDAKPQLKNEDIPTSDAKRTSSSGRSGLPRKSKNQAKHNIKSFTIFDSYSSLFDSDGDEDDVFVTQKPSQLRDVGNYSRMALPVSQGSENIGPDTNNTQILDKIISSQTSSEGKSMTSTTNAVPQFTREISQTTPFSVTLSLDELFGAPNGSSTGPNPASVSNTGLNLVSSVPSVSNTGLNLVSSVPSVSNTGVNLVSSVPSVSNTGLNLVSSVESVSNTGLNLVSSVESVSNTGLNLVSSVQSVSSTRMDHVSAVPSVFTRNPTPKEMTPSEHFRTSSALTTRQHPANFDETGTVTMVTATFDGKTPPASPPVDPNKPVIMMAQGISQVLHQMLMVASVKLTSELAVRAAVIRLEERTTSLNFLTASLLHELITVAISSLKKIRDTAPGSDASSQNSTLTSAAFSQNVTPASVVCSQNLFSKPVTCSQNSSSTPVACSKKVSPAPVDCSQKVSPVACSPNVSPSPVACSQNVSPVPVVCSQNVPPAPVACSPNVSPAPVACSQNVPPAPVACSQNLTSVPTDCSKNISPNPIGNSQNLCSTPSNNNSTESEKLTTTNTWDENREPNKNKITGQCYNCYSTAQITCRRCATALYCSLRCELEHLAIHRRECCKRQS